MAWTFAFGAYMSIITALSPSAETIIEKSAKPLAAEVVGLASALLRWDRNYLRHVLAPW